MVWITAQHRGSHEESSTNPICTCALLPASSTPRAFMAPVRSEWKAAELKAFAEIACKARGHPAILIACSLAAYVQAENLSRGQMEDIDITLSCVVAFVCLRANCTCAPKFLAPNRTVKPWCLSCCRPSASTDHANVLWASSCKSTAVTNRSRQSLAPAMKLGWMHTSYICDCLAHGKENIHPSVKSNIHK